MDLSKGYKLKTLVIKLKCLDIDQNTETDKEVTQNQAPLSVEKTEISNKDEHIAAAICKKKISINLHKLKLTNATSAKLSSEMLNKLEKTDYGSDETEVYWPLEGTDTPKFEELLISKPSEEKTIRIPPKRVIRSKPSKGGFKYSVHRVRKHRGCTYLSCKIKGCKSKFASVKDWNSHHCRVHRGIKLQRKECDKEFKTPLFLRDHTYIHSAKCYKCQVCAKVFQFKSTSQVHRRTHLSAKLYKCFAGECDCEYKWAQDFHRHVQQHLQ